ncbi:MAG: DUF488 domain-containing protein [Candidatus Binataceae bacterium]|nr:DUF488 domain-containing protein [Candidatus Binataceae bacterium]
MEPVRDKPVIFTLGHSTHPIEKFLELMGLHRLAALVDVRSFPSSKRWPQFNQTEISRSLEQAGIEYHWMKPLGGRRHGVNSASPHAAWTHPAFRAYADHTQSEEFAAGFNELLEIASHKRAAIMCSEGLWWRCHRRIIADHLVIHGRKVEHVMPSGKLVAHTLSEFASVSGQRIIYDGHQSAFSLKF